MKTMNRMLKKRLHLTCESIFCEQSHFAKSQSICSFLAVIIDINQLSSPQHNATTSQKKKDQSLDFAHMNKKRERERNT
jgi:hypothetical protein